MNTDPIADLLTRVRNAFQAGHKVVKIPFSQLKKSILDILQQYGFVQSVRVKKEDRFDVLEVELTLDRSELTLTRKSKPGQRKYISAAEIRPVRNGYGIGIISTSKGVITTREAAEQGIGGELLCEVY